MPSMFAKVLLVIGALGQALLGVIAFGLWVAPLALRYFPELTDIQLGLAISLVELPFLALYTWGVWRLARWLWREY